MDNIHLKYEIKDSNSRVQGAGPGVMTGIGATKGWNSDELEPAQNPFAAHALQRIGRPRNFGGAALYLASDASSYTTEATPRADGGIP